jgi:hypothetical protein
MPKHVTIMRRWNNPKINIFIDDDEINIKMTLNDFLMAVKEEIGAVTWTFTKDSFVTQFDNAVARIITAMKRETAKVIV